MNTSPLSAINNLLISTLLCIFTLAYTTLYGQNNNYPTSREAGKCYAQAELPNYKIEKKQIILQEAYTKEIEISAVIDTITEQYLIFDKKLDWKNYEQDFTKITAKIPIRPAIYLVIEEYKMLPDVKVAQTGFRGWHVKSNNDCNYQEEDCPETTIQWLEQPSILDTTAYNDINKIYLKKLQSPRYRNINYIKRKPIAIIANDNLPGTYISITRPVVIEPAKKIKYHYPRVYGTKMFKVPFQTNKKQEWVEVICPSMVKGLLVQQLLLALQQRQFYVGILSEEWSQIAQEGLVKYQKENHLPIGHFDQKTIESLGLNFTLLSTTIQ